MLWPSAQTQVITAPYLCLCFALVVGVAYRLVIQLLIRRAARRWLHTTLLFRVGHQYLKCTPSQHSFSLYLSQPPLHSRNAEVVHSRHHDFSPSLGNGAKTTQLQSCEDTVLRTRHCCSAKAKDPSQNSYAGVAFEKEMWQTSPILAATWKTKI